MRARVCMYLVDLPPFQRFCVRSPLETRTTNNTRLLSANIGSEFPNKVISRDQRVRVAYALPFYERGVFCMGHRGAELCRHRLPRACFRFVGDALL